MATLVSIVRILSKMTCSHFCNGFDIFFFKSWQYCHIPLWLPLAPSVSVMHFKNGSWAQIFFFIQWWELFNFRYIKSGYKLQPSCNLPPLPRLHILQVYAKEVSTSSHFPTSQGKSLLKGLTFPLRAWQCISPGKSEGLSQQTVCLTHRKYLYHLNYINI